MTAVIRSLAAALAAIAALAAVAASPAPAESAAAPRGSTSQGERATVKYSKGKVKLSLTWRADCHDGGEAFRGTVSVPSGLRLHGKRFGVSEQGREDGADGVAVAYRASLKGRVRRRLVKGTWRLTVSGTYADGGRFSCDTGVVRFTVKVRRRSKATAGVAATSKLLKLTFRSPGRRTAPGRGGGPAQAGPRPPAPPAPPPATTPDPGAPRPGAKGLILYQQRACHGAPAVGTPLAGAQVYFEDVPSGAQTGPTTTGPDGAFNMAERPSGSGPVRVLVMLESDRIRVTPFGQELFPYRIDAGLFPGDGTTFHLADGPPSAVSNIFMTLNQFARAADEMSPLPPPQVTARARWTPDLRGWLGDGGTSTSNTEPLIRVGGKADGSEQDAWERFALGHEYGHQVLRALTGPRVNAFDIHDGYATYPDNPELPYSEGFANFFAALVDGPNVWRGDDGDADGCDHYADISAKPATGFIGDVVELTLPRPGQTQWAQYQELNVAAAFYQAAQALAPGDVQAGAADIMEALLRQHQLYGGPLEFREARDALADFVTAQRGEEVDQSVGNALAEQGISYGISMRMEPPFLPIPGRCDTPPVCPRDPRVIARITGPGGVECDLEHGGQNGPDTFFAQETAYPAFKGPLPGRHDDCYVTLGFRAAPFGWTVQVSNLFWDLPFLANNGHRDATWTVQVQLRHCGYGFTTCPFPVSVPVHVGTGHWFRPGESALARAPLNEKKTSAVFNSIGDWTTVAEFDAYGVCETRGSAAGADCGVGR
jgi:hypothetical protein